MSLKPLNKESETFNLRKYVHFLNARKRKLHASLNSKKKMCWSNGMVWFMANYAELKKELKSYITDAVAVQLVQVQV